MTYAEANRLGNAIREATDRCRHSCQPIQELTACSADLARSGWAKNHINAVERAVMFELARFITASPTKPKPKAPEPDACYIIQ